MHFFLARRRQRRERYGVLATGDIIAGWLAIVAIPYGARERQREKEKERKRKRKRKRQPAQPIDSRALSTT